jgi:hypothetical protein
MLGRTHCAQKVGAAGSENPEPPTHFLISVCSVNARLFSA